METPTHYRKSSNEISQSIAVPEDTSFWRILRAFTGPEALVAIGYMDPDNWITSIVGGATYKHLLLSAILVPSLIVMQLQQVAGKLGIVTKLDLVQAAAAYLPKRLRHLLSIVIELTSMAIDLAEVTGPGVVLHLLFGWSLLFSIFITILDVFILLSLMKLRFREIEAIVSTLITTILVIFPYLVILLKPSLSRTPRGYLPNASTLDLKQSGVNSKLVLALRITGTTVMPHSLYLHSSILQTRRINYKSQDPIKQAVRFMAWDSNIQFSLAFVVNSLLLILRASSFYGHTSEINAFSQMYDALQNSEIAGSVANVVLSTLFVIALLASGQNSAIIGTLTGQIIMEGFLRLHLSQWVIRLMTRLAALTPVMVVAVLHGSRESVLDQLIVYSQVFFSIALPFSTFPLVYFVSNRKPTGEFVNAKRNTILGYPIAIILTLLNLKFIIGLL